MKKSNDAGSKAYDRTIEASARASKAANTNAGKPYKEDFKKDGTLAPSDWGSCCSG